MKNFVATILFSLLAFGMASAQDVANDKHDSDVFANVEEMPTFGDGGVEQFCYWVMTHVKYPKKAAQEGIEGVVLVQFVIYPDGKARDFEIVKSPDKSLSKSVIATIKEANKLENGWKPGRNGGEPVKVLFTLPVNFSLK